MKTYTIPHTDLSISRVGYGCAGLAAWDKSPISAEEVSKAVRAVHTAYDSGITLFDHADLYAYGKSESVFGEVLRRSPWLRQKIVVQSKCGERFPEGGQLGDSIGADLSKEHIVSSVEGSLRRLGTDYLDILLLHVADALMESGEIAEAFDRLNRDGKVRYFGVSNHNAGQIRLLKRSISQPIIVNQIRLGLSYSIPLADGMENTLQIAKQEFKDRYQAASDFGIVEYCRLNDIQIQAWSPLRGILNPSDEARSEIKKAAALLTALADSKGAEPSAVALAWLLRHPAGIVPIIGSTDPDHILECCAADSLMLSRAEWYNLFAAATEL